MNFNQSDPRRENLFKDAVLSAAEARSVEIIHGAQQAAAQQLAEARAACELADHDRLARQKVREAEREHSAALQAARRALLLHRAELVDGVFAEAEQALREFTQSDAYAEFLLARLKSFAPEPGAAKPKKSDKKLVIWLRAEDLKRFGKALEKALPGGEAAADEGIRLGGLKLQVDRAMYDMTLDAALADERERFTRDSKLTL